MTKDEKPDENPLRHVILYAKGHYSKTTTMFNDVKCIMHILFPKEDLASERVIDVLSVLAYGSISNTRHELERFPPGVLTITKPGSQMKAFREMFKFMYAARTKIADDFQNIDSAMEEIMTQSLLVMMACHEYDEIELGQIEPKIQAAIYNGLFS